MARTAQTAVTALLPMRSRLPTALRLYHVSQLITELNRRWSGDTLKLTVLRGSSSTSAGEEIEILLTITAS